MTKHTGSHPRIGAVDVVPFIPVKDVSIDEALVIARAFGKYLGDELGVPVYYYEDAATCEERKNLVRIRKGEYEALCERMKDRSDSIVHQRISFLSERSICAPVLYKTDGGTWGIIRMGQLRADCRFLSDYDLFRRPYGK